MAIETISPVVDTPGALVAPLDHVEEDLLLQKYRDFEDEHKLLLGLSYSEQLAERAKDVAAGVGVVAGFPGVFETEWAIAIGAASATTHNPIVAAGVTTLATVGIELAGAAGVSRLLASEKVGRVINWAHKQLGRLGLKEGVETSPVTDVAVAFIGGTGVMTTLKQTADPERTEAQNRSYGTKIALAVSALGGPFNLAVTEGVADIDPLKMTVGVVALAGLVSIGAKAKKYAKDRIDAKQTAEENTGFLSEPADPDYKLDADRLKDIEDRIVQVARTRSGRTVSAVWIDGDTVAANFFRTHEQNSLPTVTMRSLFGQNEQDSRFLALVDTRCGKSNRVIRGTRITGSKESENDQRDDVETITLLKGMVEDGEITAEELNEYYTKLGIDIRKSIGVETNFKIGERAPRRFGVIPMSRLAYLAMYNYVLSKDSHAKDAVIFAHVNSATVSSLERLGVTMEPIAGNPNLQTPAEPDSGHRYDSKFHPIALLNTSRTAKAMRKLAIFAPKQLTI